MTDNTHLIDDERDRALRLIAFRKERAVPNYHLEAYSFDVGWKLCRANYFPKLTEAEAKEKAMLSIIDEMCVDDEETAKIYANAVINALIANGINFKPNRTEGTE